MPINSLLYPSNVFVPTAYNVDNSLRFNRASSDYLNRTPSSEGNKRTMTFSFWLKRTQITAESYFIYSAGADASNRDAIMFANQSLRVISQRNESTYWLRNTTRLFRDSSAWSHIVIAIDTTQGTDSNRIKIYINGVQETAFETYAWGSAYPSQNFDTYFNDDISQAIGSYSQSSGNHYDGYISEFVMIDGTALDPTSFGEFDEDSGIWKPINVSGLTFGTNGFYQEYKQSGTGTNSSGMGADTSGNTNHFAVNNLTAVDQSTDTCTNNFCTWNPLDTFYSGNTYQEGNTQGTKPNDSVESFGTSTFGMSSGKWYAEFKVISFSGSNSTISFGIIDRPSVRNDMQISKYAYGIAYLNNGYLQANDGATHNVNTGTTFGAGDIIGVYIDIDNLEIYFAKNGTILNSGTGLAIQPLSSTANGVYFFAFDNFAAGGSVHQANWGNPAYTGTDKSDANGYGSFEYDPSVGTFDGVSKDFYALCTKNLSEYG